MKGENKMTDLEIIETAFDILSIQYIKDYDAEENITITWGDFYENQDNFDKDGNYIN